MCRTTSTSVSALAAVAMKRSRPRAVRPSLEPGDELAEEGVHQVAVAHRQHHADEIGLAGNQHAADAAGHIAALAAAAVTRARVASLTSE